MPAFVSHGLIAFLVPIAISGLAWLIGRAQPASLTADSGTIAPERWSAVFVVIVGVLFVGVGGVIINEGSWLLGLVAIVVGGAMGGFMIPSLTNAHVVTWTVDCVEGPSKMFGPTLGLSKTQIKWGDIVSTGKTATGYTFIEAKDYRRIYWSFLYKGYRAFESYLRTRCPSLVPYEDLDA